MDAFLISAFVVAIAEIGDKTQLLAIVLAARFKQPLPIVAGIAVATLANHALAAAAGFFAADLLHGAWFRATVAAGFLAMALWALIPDKPDDRKAHAGASAFLTTLVCFFLVEIGDKTQIATIALAARFHDIVFVAAGTTLGMMVANIPAVYLGEATTKIVPLNYVRAAAALVFASLGIWMLAELLTRS